MSSACSSRGSLGAAAGVAVLALLATPATAAAHSPPARGELWGAWNLDWALLAYVMLAAGVFVAGVLGSRSRASNRRVTTAPRAAAFFAGLALIVVAVVSPLDGLAHALLSGHMVQHMLLVACAAPAIALARPWAAFARGVPRWVARRVNRAARPLRRLRRRGGPVALAALVLVLHVGTIWIWHFPAVYGVALENASVHALSHATLFATALAFWSCIVASGQRGGVGRGAAIAIGFGAAAGTGILGALITFATVHLYPEHAASAAEWGMAPLADQQLGGVLMWVPGGMAYLAAVLVLVVRLLDESDPAAERPPARGDQGVAAVDRGRHDAPEEVVRA